MNHFHQSHEERRLCALNFGKDCPERLKCWQDAGLRRSDKSKHNQPHGSYPNDRKPF